MCIVTGYNSVLCEGCCIMPFYKAHAGDSHMLDTHTHDGRMCGVVAELGRNTHLITSLMR